MLGQFLGRAPEAVALALALALAGACRRSRAFLGAAAALLAAALLFYRGPLSVAPKPGFVVSPCDGRVLSAAVVGDRAHVAVFIGLTDVHAQYAPLDGVVVDVTHSPGTFAPAYLLRKSRFNERVVTRLATAAGPVAVVQYAGQLARRIVPFVAPGQRVRQGQALGLIKFGSRVDLWVPAASLAGPLPAAGDRVRAGDPLVRLARHES